MNRFCTKLDIIFRGHVLNPLWLPRLERRRRRGAAISSAAGAYLSRYEGFISSLKPELTVTGDETERIFSLWLQGEDNAPDIVKACWRSIRANCEEELVILDEKTLPGWIELPPYILEKRAEGKIRPAHFADICRVELLLRYGGIWMDATDFVSNPMPEWLKREDFFVYMSGDNQRGSHSFIQNCFIRSRKGNFLLKSWRDAVFEYWKNENSAIDYFVHQLIFKKLVECNPYARREFDKMPKIVQDSTHSVWFGHGNEPFDANLFNSLTSDALFQKTEYKSKIAKNPPKGSFAEALVDMYR